MPKLLSFSVFCLVLVSFLANPAPQAIELPDLILIGLPCLIALLCTCVIHSYKVFPSERKVLIALFFYLTYLLISALIGLLEGLPLLNVLRSIGPYLAFFPLLMLGFLPQGFLSFRSLAAILILVGLIQTAYLSHLYFGHAPILSNTRSVLVNRITFLDQRTTLPLLLAVPLLPLFILFQAKNKQPEDFLERLMAFALITIGLLAGMITLTRSVFLSILFGWLVFAALYFYQQSHKRYFSLKLVLKKGLFYLPFLFILLALLSAVPAIHILEIGLTSRFSTLAGSADYSNGRLYDEWLPALNTWAHGNILNILFGIGAGNTFTVLSGEERTYIHNLSIYSLVYGGLFGLLACYGLYFTVFSALVKKAYHSENSAYFSFAALLASLFFYGQLFAVHKGLAFNIMLFLIIGLALSPPLKKVKSL